MALGEKSRTRFAVLWLLAASATRPERTIEERLAREVVAVLQGESSALGRKTEMHKMSMVNRCALLPMHCNNYTDTLNQGEYQCTMIRYIVW